MASSRPSSNRRRSSRKGPVIPLPGWGNPNPRNTEFNYRRSETARCLGAIKKQTGRTPNRRNNTRCRHNPNHANPKRPPVAPMNEHWINFGKKAHKKGYEEEMRNQRRSETAEIPGYWRLF
jgi:hypothetical protein